MGELNTIIAFSRSIIAVDNSVHNVKSLILHNRLYVDVRNI